MKRFFQKINIDFKKGTHIPGLDGIRGAAIVAVVLYHFFNIPYAAWYSMDSFFVLSGFLITGILLDTRKNKHYFKNYIARRMLRILPLYYGVLIVFFLIVPLIVSESKLAPFSVYYDNQGYFWSYLQNWILLIKEADLKGVSRIFLHLWSLAVEEQFYIVWPFLILLFSTRNLVKIILLLIVFSVGIKCYYFFSGYTWQYAYFNTFARLDSLCIGGLLAIAVRDNYVTTILEKIVPYIFKILLVVLFLAIMIARPRTPWPSGSGKGGLIHQLLMPQGQFLLPLGNTIFAIFFAALILYCMSPHKNNTAKWLLELPILRFFGKYSYAMYIFHVPILALLRPDLAVTLTKHMPKSIAFVSANFICLILTMAAALVSWNLIEKPALKLKKFFSYNIAKSKPMEHQG